VGGSGPTVRQSSARSCMAVLRRQSRAET